MLQWVCRVIDLMTNLKYFGDLSLKLNVFSVKYDVCDGNIFAECLHSCT